MYYPQELDVSELYSANELRRQKSNKLEYDVREGYPLDVLVRKYQMFKITEIIWYMKRWAVPVWYSRAYMEGNGPFRTAVFNRSRKLHQL